MYECYKSRYMTEPNISCENTDLAIFVSNWSLCYKTLGKMFLNKCNIYQLLIFFSNVQ